MAIIVVAGIMRWLLPRAVGLFIVASGAGDATIFAAEALPAVRARIAAAFDSRFEALAEKCQQLGLTSQAEVTRRFLAERDPGRQYFSVPPAVDDRAPDARADDVIQKWYAKLIQIRRDRAERLFEAAKAQSREGSAPAAFQLLHDVLADYPQHAEAKRILGGGTTDSRPRARSPRLPHPVFGWPRGKWWQIESSHFQIATDIGPEAGLELAQQLEDLHCVWQQLFFDHWNSAGWLNEQFSGSAVRALPQRRHQSVLFRDRAEYLERLAKAEPNISVTLGYYHKAKQTSYFYAGDPSLLPVRYHEVTHQLFQETGDDASDVGEKWNFWVVEGIAVYLESLDRRGDNFTVGGFDADRLQFARSRTLGGEALLPLDQLVRMGRVELQQHADIRRLYTQSAAWTHFFLDIDRGRFREPFLRYLASVYRGQDTPDTLVRSLELSPEAANRDLLTFLTVRDADLKFLTPDLARRNLSLVKGEITDNGLLNLRGQDRLEWLDLSYTQVTDRGIEQLPELSKLKRLTLVGLPLSDAVAARLATCQSLEELDLAGTRITDAALPQLARLSKLTSLRLAHTSITDQGLAALSGLQQLTELDVDQTAVTNAALGRLKLQLPRLK